MTTEQEKFSFTIDTPEFDEDTYWGRFEAFRATANPFHAFYQGGRITKMQELLAQQKENERVALEKTGTKSVMLTKQEIRDIRVAETVVSTAIHPDTGKMIPWALRFSSFLPMNIPISFGFIFAAPTPFNTIFWQWLNQTYNAALNYENRNASSVYTTQDIAMSYTIATTSAIGVALGIRKAVEKQASQLKGGKLVLLNSLSSFAACALSGFLNAYIMRQTEIKKGIDVFDKETNISYGKSKICANTAVLQTSISRIFLCITIFVPPLFLVALEKKRMIPKNKVLKFGMDMSLLTFELYFAVPLGLAIYARNGTIQASELEPEFQEVKNAKGDLIKEFVFNKGL